MSFFPETRLNVTPIVFYPNGVPTDSTWHDRWLVMLSAAQQKFHAMLKGLDTFDLDQSCLIFKGSLTAAQYKALPNDGVETILAELLQHAPFNAYNRYTLPYCLAVLMIDPERAWGGGGGRNINGKINQGGGILVIPHWHTDDGKLQSTLVHELGHTFGLVHSWDRATAHGLAEASQLHECYYGQWTSPSIMSYNKANQTNSLDPTQIPGCLLGDEIDASSQNKLVFPGLFFDPATDFDCSPVQTGCPPHDGTSRELWLGPMTLFWCATSHGSKEGTKITNLNDTPARTILANGGESWDVAKKVVWRSGPLNPAGWVSLWITFPHPVTLDRVVTYSQYGRLLGRASAVQVEALHPNGFFAVLEQITAELADAVVTFAPTTSRIWKLSFHGDQSDFVILRGFRFFLGEQEVHPPEGPMIRTRSGESFGSQVANLVAIQRTIRANTPQVGFDPATMWHSAPLLSGQGWAIVDISFPEAVTLSQFRIYSQHSGQFHAAQQVQIHRLSAAGEFDLVKQEALSQPNAIVSFSEVKAQVWRLSFRGQPDGHVVLRGLRFFHGSREWYPPAVVE